MDDDRNPTLPTLHDLAEALAPVTELVDACDGGPEGRRFAPSDAYRLHARDVAGSPEVVLTEDRRASPRLQSWGKRRSGRVQMVLALPGWTR